MPLLLIIVLAYVAFAAGGADFTLPRFSPCAPLGRHLADYPRRRAAGAGAFVLFFEILKSTRTGGNSVVDHALSLIVFVICLILFLIWAAGGDLGVLPDHAHDADRRDRRLLGDHPRGKAGRQRRRSVRHLLGPNAGSEIGANLYQPTNEERPTPSRRRRLSCAIAL